MSKSLVGFHFLYATILNEFDCLGKTCKTNFPETFCLIFKVYIISSTTNALFISSVLQCMLSCSFSLYAYELCFLVPFKDNPHFFFNPCNVGIKHYRIRQFHLFLFGYFVFLVFLRQGLYSDPPCTLVIFLPLPECWDCRHKPPCLD